MSSERRLLNVSEAKDEYQRMRNLHLAECTRCLMVPDVPAILKANQGRRVKVGKPILLGLHTLPGWASHSEFFLVRCENDGCTGVFADYLHGHGNYLNTYCSSCRDIFPVSNPERDLHP